MTDTRPTAQEEHDVVVVGARCAGAPVAMLLARAGHDVLLLDRAHFPSDAVSTHLVHAPGVEALRRWGLLDAVAATGCPPITRYSFDLGPFTLRGEPQIDGHVATAYCPRRIALDAVLVDAAVAAGATLCEGTTFDDIVTEDGRVVGIRVHDADGVDRMVRARVLIGADGAHSRVAGAVGAARYRVLPTLATAVYSYWSGIDCRDAAWTLRPSRGYGVFPTNDGLTMLLAAWPHDEFATIRSDVEGHYVRAVGEVYGGLLGGATREERVIAGGVGNHFRTPYGPGWALVGDAAYLKDPVTAQGITDAFLDAELCATAVDRALSGDVEAMSTYHRERDHRVSEMFDLTTRLASLEPPPPELAHLLGSLAGDQPGMDAFASLIAGTVTPSEFFAASHARAG